MKSATTTTATHTGAGLARRLFAGGCVGVLMLLGLLALAPAAYAQVDDTNDDNGATYVGAEDRDEPVNGTSSGGGECRVPVNFESLNPGTFVTNNLTGMTVSTDAGNAPNGQPRKAMIYDANCSGSGCSGQDADLATDPGYHPSNIYRRGNVLILSEDNDQNDPDDNASGGWFIFEFSTTVKMHELDLLDIDGGEVVRIKLYDDNGTLFYDQTFSGIADNAVLTVGVNQDGVRKMKVKLSNSGAITGIAYCEVADLEVTQVVDALNSGINPGEDVFFDVTVFNNPFDDDGEPWPGATDAPNVQFEDKLTLLHTLGSVTFVGIDLDGDGFLDQVPCSGCLLLSGGAGDRDMSFDLDTIPLGATVHIRLTTVIEPGGPGDIESIGEVSASDPVDPDSQVDNCDLAGFNPTEDECKKAIWGVLPVELTAFEALLDGRAVRLNWQTASETNNAGFEIHSKSASADSQNDWHVLGWVDGHGTTERPQTYSFRVEALDPGRHVFRLKQIDFDGSFDYSPQLEVTVEMPQAYFIGAVYPNPFNPQARLRFGVRQGQQVEVSLYNMLGQRVAVLYGGLVTAGVTQEVEIDGRGLQSGVYVVRIVGERFVEARTVTLVK